MCPSYRATREEQHSTRGRARLLQEMLQGDPLDGGWRNEAIREALHLCLSCKGCLSDCPVNVDMATYKAEFQHHYYRGRLRPRAAYSMGMIHRWARLLAPVPWLANLATQTPGIGRLARAVAGIAPERPVPVFAPRTFRRSWKGGSEPAAQPDSRPRVVLWTDSFNNHFSPDALHAAAAVLEAAGCAVTVPRSNLCCGRPWYEYGRLDQARRELRRTLAGLRSELEAGAHVVGIEPSCLSVFHNEMPSLFPGDAEAERLRRRAMLLGDYLETVAHYQPPPRAGRVLVHGHCHQRAVFGMDAEVALLRRTGMEVRLLDDTCCGMAGAFGYETDKYAVSQAIFDQGWGAALRIEPPDTLLIANGFSCREQVRQLAGRNALTLAHMLLPHPRPALDEVPS